MLKQAVARDGRSAELHNDLGIILEQLGRFEEAAASYRRCAVLAPSAALPHANLGFLQRRMRRASEAVRSFRKAASLEPGAAHLQHNLGMALEEVGEHAAARACYERALALDPNFPHAHLALGQALEATGEVGAALEHYRRATALAPDLPVAHLSLGNGLAAAGRLAAAEESFRKALTLRPDYPEARHNLANALHEQGRLEEALEQYRRTIESAPDYLEARMHLVTLHLYRAGSDLAAQQQAAGEAAERIEASVRRAPTRRAAARSEMPRLGFVSGDFRTHPAGLLVLPTLEALARAGHRFACYSNSRRVDALTARFAAAAAQWRDIAGLSDEDVATRIRDDRIDMLFDLSGYTAGQRLAVFAAKPAPIQIAWAGYPGTTGLAAMDYLLADGHQLPEAAEPFYREAVIRLPDSYVCHEPAADAPEPGPPPGAAAGFVTFGSFNALKKITPPVIEAWCRILGALPESRLLIKATALDCPETRRRLLGAFTERGIAESRLRLLGSSPRAEQLAAMAQADIALDSFPYSGGVTTLEALWMGLPVITLPGTSFASRHSLGYLANLGLAGLVADSVEDYVARALALAGDPMRLAGMRAGMRARFRAAALCDVERFVGHFTQACRQAWAQHCAGAPARSFTVTE